MPEIPNADILVPIVITAGCLVLMAITWAFTRGRDIAVPAATAGSPITGQTQVTQAQLGVWHRSHGHSVKRWIENHERVLKKVSESGIAIDLNADMMAGHAELGPEIDEAIARHPAPQMRAQLSAMVLASRNTVDALRRSNWTNAEKEHLAYVEYRDTWLDRLRQFTTAESEVQALRSMGDVGSSLPGWLDREDSPPG